MDLTEVCSLLPLTMTGADFYAFVTDALYNALQRTIESNQMTGKYLSLFMKVELGYLLFAMD